MSLHQRVLTKSDEKIAMALRVVTKKALLGAARALISDFFGNNRRYNELSTDPCTLSQLNRLICIGSSHECQ